MLSAVQPSKSLTLGNYLGAIKNWVHLQDDYNCLFFAVDLHTITARQEDPAALRERTYRTIATYIAAGIDPQKATLFVQSHVPEHVELAWILTCHTYMGELGRMTQYKDKSAKQGTNIGAGLFVYPALMAADILLYRTDLVPVGEDQKQHVEITRDVALRMINLYGEDLFTVPDVFIPPVGARIMSLQVPTQKMSKSDPDLNATIFLDDTDALIRKKFKRAITDSGSEIRYAEEAQPGVSNLLSIQSALTGKTVETLVGEYAGKQYGHLKVDTAELVIASVSPLRQKVEDLMQDKAQLDAVLHQGAERAREKARKTLAVVYDRIGLLPGRYR
ncbi:tryptophan--tRNA ligase [Bdellovibrionota bacterium FG-1]